MTRNIAQYQSLSSFVPVFFVIVASFAALHAVVAQRIRVNSRRRCKTEDLVVQANEESSRRIGQFVSVPAESAGLKAARTAG